MEYCLTLDIDWPLTREVITSVVSVAGLFLAIGGYFTWRRQIIGGTQHATAKKVFLAALRVREEIRQVRKPGAVLPAESEATTSPSTHPEHRDFKRDHLVALEQVYSKRVDRLTERFLELRMAILEAETLWGKPAAATVEELGKCVGEVRAGVWEYFWLQGLYAEIEQVERNSERVKANWAIVYDTSNEAKPDRFAERVDKAVQRVETFYRPRLQLRSTWFSRRKSIE